MPAALVAAGVLFFCAIAADVYFQGRLVQADRVIAPWLYERQNWWLVFFASAVSGMGQLWFVVGVVVAGCIFLWRRRMFFEMAICLAGMSGSAIINSTLKDFFKIPRPSRHLAFVWPDPLREGYSFPSGHTMAVMLMAGLVALVLMRLWRLPVRIRFALAAAVLAMGLVEATALMVVGVHYLTDVLGAIGAATAWLGVLRWLMPPRVADEKMAPLPA